MLRVHNLWLTKKKNGREHTLLSNISLSINTNQITLFLGKSGSGKTSLLRCLSHIETDYQGEIFYRGHRIDNLPQKERCQLMGFVPQAYALFPFMTVLENCAHPLEVVLGISKGEARRQVEEIASTFDMHHLLHSYPHELSGGQQQRASILRALLLRPTFILLDEPTSALDPVNTNLLIQIIIRLKNEGKGIVVSSQDMYFAQKVCDNVYFLEQGNIVEHHNFFEEPLLPKESKLARFLYTEEAQKEEALLSR